jgi:hypothetical protein
MATKVVSAKKVKLFYIKVIFLGHYIQIGFIEPIERAI